MLVYTPQDHSDSDDESTGEVGTSGRRFFGRKRRSTDASLSFVERGQQQQQQPNTEGRLRRMSNVISRRPRNSSLPLASTMEGEAVEDGGVRGRTATAAALPSARPAWVSRERGDEVEVETRGAVAAAAAAAASEAGGRDDPPVENNEDEKEPLPPFTMALAVMLTGLRVLIVDQVRGGAGRLGLMFLVVLSRDGQSV